jgi:hypothetical protein
MRKNHNSLKSDRKSKTSRDTSLRCDTNKFGYMKKRLCLKCGEKFLSGRPYNRICEKCNLANKRIALKTFYATSKHLNKSNH